MAVDLLSFQGGTARYMDLQPQMQSSSEILLDSHNLSLLIEEIRSAIAYFSKKAPSRRHSPLFAKQARLGAVGFGLGATLLIDMLGASPALTAAVAYYGDYDVQLKHWARSDVAMLLVAGSTDVAAMAKANQTRVLLSFVGVDRIEVYCAEGAGRRFFCDHESTYHAVASKEAWHKTVPWLRSNLR